jgi:hypothetical protein
MAAEIQGEDPQEETSTDPKAQREYAFKFEHKDSTGKLRRGKFVNRILTIHQKLQVGVLRAQLCGQVNIDALDHQAWNLAEQIAHLQISLKTDKRPAWAVELTGLDDPGVINALYLEVAAHEAFFHGRGRDQETGQAAAPDIRGTDEATPPGEE